MPCFSLCPTPLPFFAPEQTRPCPPANPPAQAIKGSQARSFYTLPEYEAWCEEAPRRGWKIKYYKGLGTSTADEARQYFAALGHHRKEFVWEGDEDGQAIEMAFSKKKVEERKDWLRAFVPGTFLDHSAEHISYSEFVHRVRKGKGRAVRLSVEGGR